MSIYEPLLVDTRTACLVLGVRKTKLFAMLREGELSRVKIGSKTLVPIASLKALVERGAA